MDMNPKVFVSHASDDKKRFVLDFAEKLRSKGVDAWVDKWEMLPGDSLVDKIFEEGIKNAQAIIVVLSQFSVSKKWVREELNAGMVKKIDENSKLIPVVIDECEIPECLKSTVWERINDVSSYEDEFERIISAIYGHTSKPPLGAPPPYSQTIIDTISDLTKIDTMIFKALCEKAIEKGYPHVEPASIAYQVTELGISEGDFLDTLEILDSRGYLEAQRAMGGSIPIVDISTYGFDEYARVFIGDYDEIITAVGFELVNTKNHDNQAIMNAINQPKMVVDHILKVFETSNWVTLSQTMGDTTWVVDISPELKRKLS
jgi:hypothetical protein